MLAKSTLTPMCVEDHSAHALRSHVTLVCSVLASLVMADLSRLSRPQIDLAKCGQDPVSIACSPDGLGLILELWRL